MNATETKPHRTPRTLTLAVLLVACIAAVAAPAAVGQPQWEGSNPLTSIEGQALQGRGFDPTQIYDAAEIDAVSTFNGNLAVTVPLGRSYPIDGGSSFGLVLVYSSSVWDFESWGAEMVWPNHPGEQDQCGVFTQKWPSRTFNAGLGWRLSLGRLYEPGGEVVSSDQQTGGTNPGVRVNSGITSLWRYDSADGSSHEFHDRLHSNVPAPGGAGGLPLYSRDGSYLRLACALRNNDPCGGRVVEQADGWRRFFAPDPLDPDGTAWRPIRIEDPFGNALAISYPFADRDGDGDNELVWRIVDETSGAGSGQRVYEAIFEQTGDLFPGAGVFGGYMLSRVELPGVDGDRLGYDFAYGSAVPDNRFGGDNYPYGDTFYSQNAADRTLHLGLLASIQQPDGSRYDFTYHDGTAGLGASRLLASATLPTRGKVEWDYERLDLPSGRECPPTNLPLPLPQEWATCSYDNDSHRYVTGVRERRTYDEAGRLEGTWNYLHELVDDGGVDHCSLYKEALTTVIDPLGHRTVHHFSVFTQGDDPAGEGWTRAEFGLPFTRGEQTAGDGGPLYLSSRTYHCTDPTARGPELPATCQQFSAQWVRYSLDPVAAGCNMPDGPNQSLPAGCRGLNPRIEESRSEYFEWQVGGTVPLHYDGVLASDFDGFGHHRTSSELGDYCTGLNATRATYCSGDDRTTFVDWNSGRGNPENGTFVMPGVGERWLWTTYDRRRVSEAGASEETLFDFDPETGFLAEQRTLLSPPATGADDVRVVYLPETRNGMPNGPKTGHVASEQRFGGDRNHADGGTPEYRVDHTYEHGVLESSTAVDPVSPAIGLKLVDNLVLDPWTGSVLKSRDAARVETVFVYDDVSRLVEVRPQDDADSVITYCLPGDTGSGCNYDTAAARVTVYTDPGGGDQALESRVSYDPFGRVWRQYTRLPDGGFNCRENGYLATGWPWLEGTPRASCGLVGTSYHDHDPLGRPQRINHPDNDPSDQRRTFHQWRGKARLRIKTTPVARWDGGELGFADGIRIRYFDRAGRLWWLEEASGPPADADRRETFYEHDLADRLVRVGMYGGVSLGGTLQQRTFTYDRRGFLTAESHPEIDGAVLWSEHDSQGKPGRLHEGALGGGLYRRDLTYRYDYAGRPVSVADGSGRLIRELLYASKNRDPAAGVWALDGSDRTAGKLVQTRSHQWLEASGGSTHRVSVTESFEYRANGGRLSAYTVRSFDADQRPGDAVPALRFRVTYGHDGLGQLTTLGHPDCAGDDRCPPAANDPPRTLNRGLRHGRLRTLSLQGTQLADSISYHANGSANVVDHANGVLEKQAVAGHGMARPETLWTEGVTLAGGGDGDWASGLHSYDAAGNLFRIGAGAAEQLFLYDRVDRLVEARVAPGGPLRVQRFAFDPFGNLTEVVDDVDTTPGGAGEVTHPFPTSETSNRLTAAAYDASGNLTSAGFLNLGALSWDAENRLAAVTGTGINRQYLYTAGGERLALFDRLACLGGSCDDRREIWTVRGPGNRVLREYTRDEPNGGAVTWSAKDYVYRDAGMLASVDDTGQRRHYHLDHLGSPRLVSDGSGQRVAEHVYLPFGREKTPRLVDGERMGFTGHERDFQTEGQVAGDPERDDLDYMHARYYSPWVGRFLGVDPVRGTRSQESGQSWNRFVYALNRPVVLVDPDGRQASPATTQTVLAGVTAVRRTFDEDFVQSVPEGKQRGAVLFGLMVASAFEAQIKGDATAAATVSGNVPLALFGAVNTIHSVNDVLAYGYRAERNFTTGKDVTLGKGPTLTENIEAVIRGDFEPKPVATVHDVITVTAQAPPDIEIPDDLEPPPPEAEIITPVSDEHFDR